MFVWKCKGPRLAKITLKRKEQNCRVCTAWFQDEWHSCNNQDSTMLAKI